MTRYYPADWTYEMPPSIPLGVIAVESRGNPNALGCSGEIGLFQLLPSDRVLPVPSGCGDFDQPTFAGHPTTAQLLHSVTNIRQGLRELSLAVRYAIAWLSDEDPNHFKPDGNTMARVRGYEWWTGEGGRTALAVYNCGLRGVQEGRCHDKGGYVYADEILTCWAPWLTRELKLSINHPAYVPPWQSIPEGLGGYPQPLAGLVP